MKKTFLSLALVFGFGNAINAQSGNFTDFVNINPLPGTNTTSYITLNGNSDSATSINFKNTSGFWHISGPRSYEPNNPFSFYWNKNGVWNRYFNILDNGRIGIGTSTPNTKLHLHEGVLMISGQNPFGGAMITFSDDVADNKYPNGRWGIEYVPSTGFDENGKEKKNGGLNFWKPFNGGRPDGTDKGGTNYHLYIKDDGKISIGLDASKDETFKGDYKLYVADGIMTEKVKVAVKHSSDWADYVFKPDYKLMNLNDVKQFIKVNGHLPGVPSAEEVSKKGIDVAKMDAKLLEKIEELTLYLIQLKEENIKLSQRLNAIENSK